ncbi:MAG TPA: ABC transporter permease subunit [Actinomycetota bacterium]|nr:ABC transporter permease subunit [Actinomycetota bacterium]
MSAVARSVRPPLWRNVRALRIAGQVVFVVALLLVGREMFLNLEYGLAQRARDLSLDFFGTRAGFGISEGITYSPNDTTRFAYIVGVMNTLRVAVFGVMLASVVGLIMGVARLSSNWLVRRIAQAYVDFFRNTPILIQIIFWWAAVFLALPTITEAISIGGVAFISNRAVAIPWPRIQEGAGVWGLFLLGGVLLGIVLARWRTRVNEATGKPHYRVLWFLAAFLVVGAVGFVISGDPVMMDVPEPGRFGFFGGFQLTPEFGALLVALAIYTSAFIAEIVRGSIQAVEKGQKEAAEALGLTRVQQLRFVILPQALRIAIPPVNSQYLNLTKNTSLAIAIGYPDLMSVSTTIINQRGHETEMLLVAMATFLIMTLTISFVMNLLNRAVTTKGQRR